jgi:hypothetical protein
VRPKITSTLPSSERTWFFRRETTGTITWATVRPYEDDSAIVRLARDMRTFPPPDGLRHALASLLGEGFRSVEDARADGTAPTEEPPAGW